MFYCDNVHPMLHSKRVANESPAHASKSHQLPARAEMLGSARQGQAHPFRPHFDTAFRTFTLRFLVAVALASVTSGTTCALKLRQSVEPPHNWVNLGRAPSSYIILLQISDQFRPSYGKHLSKEDVEALVAPPASSINAIHEWLESHGVQKGLTMRLPVAQEFRMWKHAEDGDGLVRTTQYSLPPYLDEYIELIQPTMVFNRAKALCATYHFTDLDSDTTASSQSSSAKITVPRSGVTVDASCNKSIMISCLKQLYNVFYADQVPAAVDTSFNVVLINGGLNNRTLAEAGDEANVDVQFALGISYPTPGTFYLTGGRAPFIEDVSTPNATNEPYGDWLYFVLEQHSIPQVISTSYADEEQSGARGVSLLFSSGDGGIICFTNHGKNETRFLVGFLATSVGSTTHIPEVAANLSGGGFSNYMQAAVTKFLESLPEGTYAGLFNGSGRALLDVSAQAESFRIFHQGSLVHRTLALAPSVAAFVSLLNDARIAAGKPSLGFLNPLIYTLNDSMTSRPGSGNAAGCGTPGFNVSAFSHFWVWCTSQYGSEHMGSRRRDGVMVFRTPDFEVLKEIVLTV
ncbi:subtilisin-like protein [Lactarius pseudohatsudake]|nr:subtilisin-like protein [Lactarius pseudohatsudake]